MSVKLLFDENISPKLVDQLADVFANSQHVDTAGLGEASDVEIWEFAKNRDLIIVTKDGDFADLSIFKGFPPRVLWIRRGNCSTKQIEQLLRESQKDIEEFVTHPVFGTITLF